MNREELRKKALAALDRGLSAPRWIVGEEEKRLLVAIRRTVQKTIVDDSLDDVLVELRNRA